MNHLFRLLGCCLVATAIFTGCDYDEARLREDLDNLTDRVESLESRLESLNKNLDDMALIIQNLQDNVYVSDVEKTADGCIITFSNKTQVEIKNGKAGENGATIGVKKDTDGIYYWTLTAGGKTDWLTDEAGKKIAATGMAPVLGVDAEGYWTVSYDGGTTISRIEDADGQPVKAVGVFSDVAYDDDFVTITLADGTQLQLPRTGGFGVTINDAAENEEFAFGETKTYTLEINSVEQIVVTKPDEWKAAVNGETLTVTAPAKEHAECAELSGVVQMLCINAAGLTKVTSLAVSVAVPEGIPALEITIPTDFSSCNIQRVVYNGIKVAEICLEYINTVDEQRTVIYPAGEDGKADLTKGIDTTTGGTVVWNTETNTCTYTAGSAALTKIYYDGENGTLTTTADPTAVAATVEPDLLVDVRGNETESYKITKIGTQYWLAESLRTEYFNDGTAISTDWSNADGAYIYLSEDRASYRTMYGTMYSGRTIVNSVDKLAPEGWDIPEADAITALRNYLGTTPATKIKSTTGWTGSYPGNNITGFNAAPAQYYAPSNNVDNFGNSNPDVYFWTKTTGKDILSRDLSIVYYRLYYSNTRIISDPDLSALSPSYHTQDFGHYVRCIRK